jgi:hypothetical protein
VQDFDVAHAKRLGSRILSALGLWLLLGCDQHSAPSTYRVAVLVEGDPSMPLAAASVVVDGKPLGATGADGRATLRLQGKEGDVVPVSIRCPADHKSPPAPIAVPLRRLEDPSRVPLYQVSCPPEVRTIVVAVRATQGPDLPVMYLGKEVARTDASGAAHVQLRLHPEERFELMLNTEGEGEPRLRPQNPTAVFVAKDRDELLFFDQRFEVEKPKRRIARPGPKPF